MKYAINNLHLVEKKGFPTLVQQYIVSFYQQLINFESLQKQ